MPGWRFVPVQVLMEIEEIGMVRMCGSMVRYGLGGLHNDAPELGWAQRQCPCQLRSGWIRDGEMCLTCGGTGRLLALQDAHSFRVPRHDFVNLWSLLGFQVSGYRSSGEVHCVFQPREVTARLRDACAGHPSLWNVGEVNPQKLFGVPMGTRNWLRGIIGSIRFINRIADELNKPVVVDQQ